MIKTTGSCLCGAVRFELEGEFEHFFICHCSYCRKDTGSAHAANLFTRTDALRWISGKDNITTFNLAPTRHVKSFCKTCGSAVPNTTMGGDICIVPAGSLDDNVARKPDAHIFTASQASWEEALASIQRFEELPQ